MQKLAEITGKKTNAPTQTNLDTVGEEQRSSSILEQDELPDNGDIYEGREAELDLSVSDDSGSSVTQYAVEAEFIPSTELRELAAKWGANIGENEKLIGNVITMNRKDYLKYVKNLNRSEILDDPLLYILFRSEDQAEVNFFSWLEKFPKEVKNESK